MLVILNWVTFWTLWYVQSVTKPLLIQHHVWGPRHIEIKNLQKIIISLTNLTTINHNHSGMCRHNIYGVQHDGIQAFVKWILGWSSCNCYIYHEPVSDKECEEQSSSINMYRYQSQCFSFKCFWLCCICSCSRWAKK